MGNSHIKQWNWAAITQKFNHTPKSPQKTISFQTELPGLRTSNPLLGSHPMCWMCLKRNHRRHPVRWRPSTLFHQSWIWLMSWPVEWLAEKIHLAGHLNLETERNAEFLGAPCSVGMGQLALCQSGTLPKGLRNLHSSRRTHLNPQGAPMSALEIFFLPFFLSTAVGTGRPR